ncbi:MAG: DoxX family protein [Candidatus Woesearchaeota archaeon]|nr:DoxX family protein [Candidatus Woesearchaeota archaeon]
MNAAYSPTILRVALSLLFIVPGLDKLLGMISGGHMIVNILWGLAVLGWILALVEILFGLAVLLGWRLQWTVWPLVLVMLGAVFLAVIPAGGPMMLVNIFFHVLAVAALVSLSLSGPGAMAVDA